MHRFKSFGWLGAAVLVIAGGYFSGGLGAANCSLSLNPTSATVSAAGLNGSNGNYLTFYATTSCPINISSGYSWLHPVFSSRSGSGDVSTVVDSNTSTSSRNGFIQVTTSDSSTSSFFSVQQAGNVSCTPTKLAVTFVSSPLTFSAGFPTVITVNVSNDCGAAVNTGSVAASFSNGDAPLNLTSQGNGTWSGSWIPRNIQSQVTVFVAAFTTQGNQSISATAAITATQGGSSATPTIGGIADTASFLVRPFAPGSIISIFGTNLASTFTSFSTIPVPTNLGGTSVFIGGKAAPLFFVSPGQINAVVPFSATLNTTQQVLVQAGNAFSVPTTIQIAAASPGVFTVSQTGLGAGAILNQDGSLNTASNPAPRGSVVSIFCSGLGAVNPSVADGVPAPTSSPLAVTTNLVAVGIQDAGAAVFFSGLAPGFVGLYQVNVQIPASTPVGSQIPLQIAILSGGNTFLSPNVTLAVK